MKSTGLCYILVEVKYQFGDDVAVAVCKEMVQTNYCDIIVKNYLTRSYSSFLIIHTEEEDISMLDILEKNYTPEEILFSELKQLFHNTALYAVQPENHVKYTNIKQWFDIQQRCFNRGVNVSKTFINYMMQYLPKKL